MGLQAECETVHAFVCGVVCKYLSFVYVCGFVCICTQVTGNNSNIKNVCSFLNVFNVRESV